MGQQWDQRRNQKIHWNKWKWETTIQNLWDTGKAIQRGEFIALQAYLKQEKAQINDLTLHLKELEEEQKIKTKVSRRKAKIKIGAEIDERVLKKIQNINDSKSQFFEKINKIERPLTRLIKNSKRGPK